MRFLIRGNDHCVRQQVIQAAGSRPFRHIPRKETCTGAARRANRPSRLPSVRPIRSTAISTRNSRSRRADLRGRCDPVTSMNRSKADRTLAVRTVPSLGGGQGDPYHLETFPVVQFQRRYQQIRNRMFAKIRRHDRRCESWAEPLRVWRRARAIRPREPCADAKVSRTGALQRCGVDQQQRHWVHRSPACGYGRHDMLHQHGVVGPVAAVHAQLKQVTQGRGLARVRCGAGPQNIVPLRCIARACAGLCRGCRAAWPDRSAAAAPPRHSAPAPLAHETEIQKRIACVVLRQRRLRRDAQCLVRCRATLRPADGAPATRRRDSPARQLMSGFSRRALPKLSRASSARFMSSSALPRPHQASGSSAASAQARSKHSSARLGLREPEKRGAEVLVGTSAARGSRRYCEPRRRRVLRRCAARSSKTMPRLLIACQPAAPRRRLAS